MIELKINGTDAMEMGIRMGKTFLSSLDGFGGIKELVENKSRIEHGRSVIRRNVMREQREVTLPFVIFGDSAAQYRARRDAFENLLLTNGGIDIEVPTIEEGRIYHLTYTGAGVSYNMSRDMTHGMVSLKFIEDNPADRK